MSVVETNSIAASSVPTTSNVTILLVDDSALQAKSVAKLFVKLGFPNVMFCDDPFQVIPMMKKGGIDIVFCDWNMPGCTGGELYQAIKKESDIAEIPFVVLTANSQKEQVIQAVRTGVKEYVIKPATMEILQTKMTLVKKREEPTAPSA